MPTDEERVRQMPTGLRTICEEVAHRGWHRVIVLGDDLRDGPWSLRACLAQSGILVLAPGPAERAWLAELCDRASTGIGPDGTEHARLASLLADGIEHGADGLLLSHAMLASLVREAVRDVPILEVGEALA